MQERLDHSDIGITLNTYTYTYTHTASEQYRRAGDRLEEVLAPAESWATHDSARTLGRRQTRGHPGRDARQVLFGRMPSATSAGSASAAPFAAPTTPSWLPTSTLTWTAHIGRE
ncbi:MAG TPA: hypothetical protein VGR26_08725 [Acidimicrobiales bacterium]|nr:hypothetical protein [Acidimicrobiales bacterium]